jgi:hypothetical protein
MFPFDQTPVNISSYQIAFSFHHVRLLSLRPAMVNGLVANAGGVAFALASVYHLPSLS